MASLLERAFSHHAAHEPKFWTVPPLIHLQELLWCTVVSLATLLAYRAKRMRLSATTTAVGARTRTETALGALLFLFMPVNLFNKLVVMRFDVDRSFAEMFLPCHVYNAIAAYCLLGCSPAARATGYNLLLYCSWMPVMAMAFPDLGASRSLASPTLRAFSTSLFWAHHVALLVVPIYAHRRAAAGRFSQLELRAVAGLLSTGFLQYLTFIYFFLGVFLCALSLALGRNLNYSLWPPNTLPEAMYPLLGGAHYRLTIGTALAYAAGPLMRHAVVPALSGLWRLVAGEAKAKAS